jgi:hypothetical protein
MPVRQATPARNARHDAIPRGAGGWPDYVAYLRARQLEGHPLSANALVPMLHAIGPALLDEAERGATLEVGLNGWHRPI